MLVAKSPFQRLLTAKPLKETLTTLYILFSSADSKSPMLLEKEVNHHGLDHSLLEPPPPDHSYHETQRAAILPTSVTVLYQKLSYEGERPYGLWVEAEDPMPITTVGKWPNSKISGRHVYWVGFVATIIAIIIFVIAAMAPAAMRVWIGFCN
ncbi:hypothetical protein PG994_004455 [Apiospora phragmitis]|uniref:Uncharacterized protein n=1 Tax=Apiospora phragmitis TaxID=2905665 RepID=A0ABR1VQN2_9PEZI